MEGIMKGPNSTPLIEFYRAGNDVEMLNIVKSGILFS